jgi:hypothetical protein
MQNQIPMSGLHRSLGDIVLNFTVGILKECNVFMVSKRSIGYSQQSDKVLIFDLNISRTRPSH